MHKKISNKQKLRKWKRIERKNHDNLLGQSSRGCELNPPFVKRGVNSHEFANPNNSVGIHWLRISCPNHYLQSLKDWLNMFFTSETADDGRGINNYSNRVYWPNGASISYDIDPDRSELLHNSKITLDIRGSALDALNDEGLFDLITGLKAFEAKCTRLDLFYDDYTRRILPYQVYAIAKRRDFAGTGYRSDCGVMYRTKTGKLGLSWDQVDFGTRGQNGSGRYLRCYDKWLESKGQFKCVRWEVEHTKLIAEGTYNALANAQDLSVFKTLIGNFVGGSITFVHRKTGEKNVKRLVVYKFWSEILADIGADAIRAPQKVQTFSKIVNWVERAVSPSLAMLRGVYENDTAFTHYILQLIAAGAPRMSPKLRCIEKLHRKSVGLDSMPFIRAAV